MNAEGTRDPERHWHTFRIPPGMKDREALEHFERCVKPKAFVMDKYKYHPQTGTFFALGDTCQ